MFGKGNLLFLVVMLSIVAASIGGGFVDGH